MTKLTRLDGMVLNHYQDVSGCMLLAQVRVDFSDVAPGARDGLLNAVATGIVVPPSENAYFDGNYAADQFDELTDGKLTDVAARQAMCLYDILAEHFDWGRVPATWVAGAVWSSGVKDTSARFLIPHPDNRTEMEAALLMTFPPLHFKVTSNEDYMFVRRTTSKGVREPEVEPNDAIMRFVRLADSRPPASVRQAIALIENGETITVDVLKEPPEDTL